MKKPIAGDRVKHKKRGTSYVVKGAALLQTTNPLGDDAELIIYESVEGVLYARPVTEFVDGRFEELEPLQSVLPEFTEEDCEAAVCGNYRKVSAGEFALMVGRALASRAKRLDGSVGCV